MNCVFRHKYTGQYVVNHFGEARFTADRVRATVYALIERETLAAKLNIRPSELVAETL